MTTTQQCFLLEAANTLNLSLPAFAERMGVAYPIFEQWIRLKDEPDSREMPIIAWSLVREILAHEQMKITKNKHIIN